MKESEKIKSHLEKIKSKRLLKEVDSQVKKMANEVNEKINAFAEELNIKIKEDLNQE